MKRKIVLVAALVAGVLAALLTRFYLSAKEAEIAKMRETLNRRYRRVPVIVLTRDLPPGATLTRNDLGTLSFPAAGLVGKAITEEDSWQTVVGRKLVFGRRKGEPLFWSDVEGGDPRATGLSSDVKKKMRAVSINCSGAASVSGMVRPNDHVDVIGTFDLTDPTRASGARAKNLVTCTILQNVLVLATGSQTAKTRLREGQAGTAYSLVTLEVTPREAEMLAFAEQIKGRLVLTLRNRNDTYFERELPKVDFDKICGEIEQLNEKRQQQKFAGN